MSKGGGGNFWHCLTIHACAKKGCKSQQVEPWTRSLDEQSVWDGRIYCAKFITLWSPQPTSTNSIDAATILFPGKRGGIPDRKRSKARTKRPTNIPWPMEPFGSKLFGVLPAIVHHFDRLAATMQESEAKSPIPSCLWRIKSFLQRWHCLWKALESMVCKCIGQKASQNCTCSFSNYGN